MKIAFFLKYHKNLAQEFSFKEGTPYLLKLTPNASPTNTASLF